MVNIFFCGCVFDLGIKKFISLIKYLFLKKRWEKLENLICSFYSNLLIERFGLYFFFFFSLYVDVLWFLSGLFKRKFKEDVMILCWKYFWLNVDEFLIVWVELVLVF